MKKVLFASTALVAAGLMTAGTASASEKIKLNLGGFSKWWVVGAWGDNSYQGATNNDFNNVDVKGDNEIYFGGSTTLDNGMKVGIQIEMEAGGHSETAAGNSTTGDVIDESYIFVETGFGKFIVGSENNGTYLLHVQAPDAAANWGEGGVMTSGSALAIPAAVQGVTPTQRGWNTTAIVTDNDADKITYVAPTFYGLTLGASYVPSSSEDNRGVTNLQTQTTGEIYGVGGLYANTFGGVGVKLSAGWVTYDVENGINAQNAIGAAGRLTNDNKTGVTEWSTGLNLSYAGFTLGTSYRNVNGDEALGGTLLDVDAHAFDVGLMYASGPYAVSLSYYQSEAEGTQNVAGDDEIQFVQLSGKYTLGAGVDVLASIGYASFDDETTNMVAGKDANSNDGWTVMTGLGLTF